MSMIKIIERELNKKAKIDFYQFQPGDVKESFADIEHSKNLLGYYPLTPISKGIPAFIKWYKSFYV